MTNSERAKLARIDKRRADMFSALAVISAWIGIGVDPPEELIYRIKEFVTGKLEFERAEAEKEKMREIKDLVKGKAK